MKIKKYVRLKFKKFGKVITSQNSNLVDESKTQAIEMFFHIKF